MNMRQLFKSFTLFIIIIVVCGFGVRARSSALQHDRPNIIFILTDDQRFDMMGCAGNPIIRTPQMDALARVGVRFSHALVTTPICAASRASILTGLYERTHDFTFNKPPLKKEYTDQSYPVALRHAGYRTGFVGKLGVDLAVPVDSIFQAARISGFPYWKEVNGGPRHLTGIQCEQAIDFIRENSKDGPFCLSLSFSAPHADDDSRDQYFWEPELDTFYQHAVMPVPATADPAFYEALPDFLKGTMSRERWHWRFDTPDKFQSMVRGYYRMITQVDMALGKIRTELDRLGIAENTVIIFMGDNGYFLGDRGFADKWLMYDQSIRVPMIIYDPRQRTHGGRVIDGMVLNIDVAPTIFELAGLSPFSGFQGRSLAPFLQGKDPFKRDTVFCEHLMEEPKIPNSEGIRTSDWKFIRYPKHPEYPELYDLRKDPDEMKNIASDPRYSELIRSFQLACDQRVNKLLASRRR